MSLGKTQLITETPAPAPAPTPTVPGQRRTSVKYALILVRMRLGSLRSANQLSTSISFSWTAWSCCALRLALASSVPIRPNNRPAQAQLDWRCHELNSGGVGILSVRTGTCGCALGPVSGRGMIMARGRGMVRTPVSVKYTFPSRMRVWFKVRSDRPGPRTGSGSGAGLTRLRPRSHRRLLRR